MNYIPTHDPYGGENYWYPELDANFFCDTDKKFRKEQSCLRYMLLAYKVWLLGELKIVDTELINCGAASAVK